MNRTTNRLRLGTGIAAVSLLLSPARAQVREVGQLLLVSPVPQAHARFGAALALGDFDACGDLLVGLPGRDHGGWESAGVVNVLFGAMFADGFEIGSSVQWSSTVTP